MMLYSTSFHAQYLEFISLEITIKQLLSVFFNEQDNNGRGLTVINVSLR